MYVYMPITKSDHVGAMRISGAMPMVAMQSFHTGTGRCMRLSLSSSLGRRRSKAGGHSL